MGRKGKGKSEQRSGNHLLNFAPYTPPPPTSGGAPYVPRTRTAADIQAVKKASLLQNFQFILAEDCETQLERQYGVKAVAALHDADAMVSWDLVKYVVVRESLESYQCPICLETPVAPRMTSCSHVYCYGCILRYLIRQKALGQQRTCPLCSAFVSPSGLKPVVYFPIQPLQPKDHATFTLLSREKHGCCLSTEDAAPALVETHELRGAYLPFCEEEGATFSRYSVETPGFRNRRLESDIHDLQVKMTMIDSTCCPLNEDDAAELDALSNALQFITSDGPAGDSVSPTPARRRQSGNSPKCTAMPDIALRGKVAQRISATGLGTNLHCDPPSSAVGLVTISPVPELVQFYRLSDGQQVYLHFLNVRMLKEDAASRGGTMPSYFCAPIVDMEQITQTHQTRSLFRPLAHIPIHGSFTMVFVDLSDVVSRETMDQFKKPIADRLRRLKEMKDEEDHYLKSQSREGGKRWEDYKRGVVADWGISRSPQISPEMLPKLESEEGLPPMMELPPATSPAPQIGSDGVSQAAAFADPHQLGSNGSFANNTGSSQEATPPLMPIADGVSSSATNGTTPPKRDLGKWGGGSNRAVGTARGGNTAPTPQWGDREWSGLNISARPPGQQQSSSQQEARVSPGNSPGIGPKRVVAGMSEKSQGGQGSSTSSRKEPQLQAGEQWARSKPRNAPRDYDDNYNYSEDDDYGEYEDDSPYSLATGLGQKNRQQLKDFIANSSSNGGSGFAGTGRRQPRGKGKGSMKDRKE